jgi:hypothetical protein
MEVLTPANISKLQKYRGIVAVCSGGKPNEPFRFHYASKLAPKSERVLL